MYYKFSTCNRRSVVEGECVSATHTHTPSATNDGNCLSLLVLTNQTWTSHGCVILSRATTGKTHKTEILRTKCEAFQREKSAKCLVPLAAL